MKYFQERKIKGNPPEFGKWRHRRARGISPRTTSVYEPAEAVTCCVAVGSIVRPVSLRTRHTAGRPAFSAPRDRAALFRIATRAQCGELRAPRRVQLRFSRSRARPCNGIVHLTSTPISAKNYGECNAKIVDPAASGRSRAGFGSAIRFSRERDARHCLKYEIVRHVTRWCDHTSKLDFNLRNILSYSCFTAFSRARRLFSISLLAKSFSFSPVEFFSCIV